eukprot:6524890-Pyramimonas_sp.AAC.1
MSQQVLGQTPVGGGAVSGSVAARLAGRGHREAGWRGHEQRGPAPQLPGGGGRVGAALELEDRAGRRRSGGPWRAQIARRGFGDDYHG